MKTLKTLFPSPTKKNVKSSLSNSFDINEIYRRDYIRKKDLSEMSAYVNLGNKECETLWNNNDKLNPDLTLTIISFDSCKHLLGDKNVKDNWLAFRTGAINQLIIIGRNKSEIVGHYSFIEKSDTCISLLELEKSVFNKYIQIEYADLLRNLDLEEDLELFFNEIFSDISISSFIPEKHFTKYLQILY